jgi:hypothetical protein
MTTLEEHMIPDGFKELILDLSGDLYNTFPEYETLFKSKNCNVYDFYSHREKACPKKMLDEYNHCCNTYRQHFFDILYENETLFQGSEPLYLLTNVDFKLLWRTDDLTDNTRKTLWKYIQLILFKVVENASDSGDFGNSEAFFEAIDENALKTKMTETIEEIKKVFNNIEQKDDNGENISNTNDNTNDNNDNNSRSRGMKDETMPNMDHLHEHLSGLFKGKIGRLAEEIMNETREEWETDFGIKLDDVDDVDDVDGEKQKNTSNINNINDIFSKLLKDPLKLVNLIKKIGSKLESKIKSGEVKESELLEETTEMMKNLKNTPGLKDMEKLFKVFSQNNSGDKEDPLSKGMANMMSMMGGKNASKNMSSFQREMDKNIKMSKQRERMLKKLEEKRAKKEDI